MATSRTQISDIEALAAMPGLEEISSPLAPHVKGKQDPVALTFFNAAQWAAGSRTELYSLLCHDGVWDRARKSAARVGRQLPAHCPSDDQWDKVAWSAKQAGVDLGEETAALLTASMKKLVTECGLLPDQPQVARRPAKVNTLVGDGTGFKPYSAVREIDGELVGSRATDPTYARISETFQGKLGRQHDSEKVVPLALTGVRGDRRLQRCILDLGIYFDRNELGESLRQLDHVIGVYGSRVHAYTYDLLAANGTTMNFVMRRGVVPIVNMTNASRKGDGWLAVPKHLQAVYGTRSKPLETAPRVHIDTVSHTVNGTPCHHELWALAGSVRVPFPEQWAPDWTSPVAEMVDLRFEHDRGAQRCLATYVVPCSHGDLRHTIDLTARQPLNKAADVSQVLRPLELDGPGGELRGRRSDVESTFSTLKGTLIKPGRVRSLDLDRILLDMVGAALWANAIAWDVHAAQHTTIGQIQLDEILRRETRIAEGRQRRRRGERQR